MLLVRSFFRPLLGAVLTALVAACATDGSYESRPSPAVRPAPSSTLPLPPAPAPARETPRPLPVPLSPPTTGSLPSSPPPITVSPPPAPPPSAPARPFLPPTSASDGRALVGRLLPPNVADRKGWAADIFTAFDSLQVPLVPEKLCATMAVVEQESSFIADPPVAGLSRIVWREIDRRRESYGIPKLVVDLALLKPSLDGRSYKARIDALRTEKQMNALFDDMISELPFGKTLFAGYNPVRTGGPMQVSIEFAEEQTRQQSYPYRRSGSVRDEVFTRRGGVYFGIAFLLDYPTTYSQMLHRFADFNAGRYASRNAAFQAAVARLSGHSLELDGDLLRYKDGVATAETSATERAVLALRSRIGLGEAAIRRDLGLEKSFAFEQSALYERVYALTDTARGERAAREILPRIALKSPKITRNLTTEWFARRVDGRYRNCLARSWRDSS